MLCQLSWVTIWLSVWIIRPLWSHVLLILEMNKVQHVKWCMKQSSLLLPNRFLPSSVGRVLDWWSRGCEFNPTGGNFWQIYFVLCNFRSVRLSDRKCVSWKTSMATRDEKWPREPPCEIHSLIFLILIRLILAVQDQVCLFFSLTLFWKISVSFINSN